MNYRKLVNQFSEKSVFDASDIPIEEIKRIQIKCFIKKLSKEEKDIEKLRLSFLLSKLSLKIPDATLKNLIALAETLTKELDRWLDIEKIKLSNIDTRIEITEDFKVIAFLCNHSGGECDCPGDHI